jgi:hypothetical protein
MPVQTPLQIRVPMVVLAALLPMPLPSAKATVCNSQVEAAATPIFSQIAALDRLERVLLLDLTPAANELFVLFGHTSNGAPIAVPDIREFATAAQPLVGTDDRVRAAARDQRVRGAALWAMAKARRLDPPAGDLFRPWVDELAEDIDALLPRHRAIFLLSLAMLRAEEGGNATGPLDRLDGRVDLRPIDRTASRILRTVVGVRAKLGAPTTAMSEAFDRARLDSPMQQLLTADGIASVVTDPAGVWCGLFDAADAESRAALSEPLAARLRTLPFNAESARPLHLIARARTATGDDATVVHRRLTELVGADAGSPLRPLALFELGAIASDGQRYLEAQGHFLHLARHYPEHPLAMAAMEIALLVSGELHRASVGPDLDRAPDPEALERLDEAVRYALATFPASRERTAWIELSAEIAFLRGNVAGTRDAAASLGSAPGADRARLLAAEVTIAAEDVKPTERLDAVGRDLADLDRARLEGTMAARREIVRARHALLAGEPDRAVATATSVVLDVTLPMSLRGRALQTLLRALDASGGRGSLPERVGAAVRSDPNAWWPAVRETLRRRVEEFATGTDETSEPPASPMIELLGTVFLDVAAADGDAGWRIRLADAMVRSGQCALVDRIFPASESHRPAALLQRAEARRRLGGAEDRTSAMRLFREAMDAAAERSLEWWRAELGQLRLAAAGATTVDAVRARIHWLRSLDTNLGGSVTGPQIEALLRSLPDR